MWLFHANPPSDLDEVHVLYKRAVQLLDCGNGRAVLFRDAGERVSLLNRVVSRGRFLTGRAELLVDLVLHGVVVVSGGGETAFSVCTVSPFPSNHLRGKLVDGFPCRRCRSASGRCAFRVSVESSVFNNRRKVDVTPVHVDSAVDAGNGSVRGALPDAISTGVRTFRSPLRYPDGETLPDRLGYHGVQARKRSIEPGKVAESFHLRAERRDEIRAERLPTGKLTFFLNVEINRVIELLFGENARECPGLLFRPIGR